MPKLHMYDPDAITRSVLDGVKATAACGFEKLLTREDVDRAANRPMLKVCAACKDEVVKRSADGDVTIASPRGWTDHLERQARVVKYTVTVSTGTTTWGFPLAG